MAAGGSRWASPVDIVGVFAQVLYADMWSDIGCSGV
jgi:hypothetical protein